MKVVLQPYAARLFNGNRNPKNYPWFNVVVETLSREGYEVIQIGSKGEDRIHGVAQFIVGWPLMKLKAVVEDADTFLAVDSFLPHFAHVECNRKRGVIVWSLSDPAIWGHPENLNLLKSRSYLREFQFQSWQEVPYNYDAFVEPTEVIAAVKQLAPRPANIYQGIY